jgi:hypothetical protein
MPHAVLAAPPLPLTNEQRTVLEAVRTSALAYTARLPDFICTQVTHRVTRGRDGLDVPHGHYISEVLPGAVIESDEIEEQLTYFQQRENYAVVAINRHNPNGVRHAEIPGSVTIGEFGSELRGIFDPRSQTEFRWDRTAKLRGRTVWVFRFRVPQAAGMPIIAKGTGQEIVVPYDGEVFVDVQSREVLRLTSRVEIPHGFPLVEAERELDYEPVEIAGKIFTLPLHAAVRMEDNTYSYVNTIDFKKYQRYATTSTIHYDGGPQ